MKIIKLIIFVTINHGVEIKSDRDSNRSSFYTNMDPFKIKMQACDPRLSIFTKSKVIDYKPMDDSPKSAHSQDIKDAIAKQIQEKKKMTNNNIKDKLKALNDKFDQYSLNNDINKLMKIVDDYCLCFITNYSAKMDISEEDYYFKTDAQPNNCFLTNDALQRKIKSNLLFEICVRLGKILRDKNVDFLVLSQTKKEESSTDEESKDKKSVKSPETFKYYLCDKNPRIGFINDVPTDKTGFCLINNCINLVDDFKGKNEVFVSSLKEFYNNFLDKNNKILNYFYGKSHSEEFVKEFFTEFNIFLNNVIGVNGFTSFESFKGFNLISKDKRVLWNKNGFHLINNEDLDILLESNVFFNFLDISRKLLKNLLNTSMEIIVDGLKDNPINNQYQGQNDENKNIINIGRDS